MSAFQFVCSLGRLAARIAVCGLAFLSAESKPAPVPMMRGTAPSSATIVGGEATKMVSSARDSIKGSVVRNVVQHAG
jgi:hypothetical protein